LMLTLPSVVLRSLTMFSFIAGFSPITYDQSDAGKRNDRI
jgi:hypothetical protein